MREKVFFLVTLLSLCKSPLAIDTDHSRPQNLSTDIQILKYPTSRYQPTDSKTKELIKQQSENVRHIIATEQKNLELLQQKDRQDGSRKIDYEKSYSENGRFPTLEELRVKCQHFSKLFGSEKVGSSSTENYGKSDGTERHSTTVKPASYEYHDRRVEVSRRPVFIRNKGTFIEKLHGGFYVTAPTTGNEKSTTIKPFWTSTTTYPRMAYSPSGASTKYSSTTWVPSTAPPATSVSVASSTNDSTVTDHRQATTARSNIQIKYTKFEPVILQKIIFTDGRAIYHWYRSLPRTAIDLPVPAAPFVPPVIQPSPVEYPLVPIPMQLSRLGLGPIEMSTPEPTVSSTTTTEKSNWLFVPFSNLFGGSNDEQETKETTAVEINTAPTTTTSTTERSGLEAQSTPKSKLEQPTTENEKPVPQLKLVVPVHYDDIDATHNTRLGYYRDSVIPPNAAAFPSLALGVPQNLPSYSMGYTGTGYGLTVNNALPYGRPYGPEYMNYQPYLPLGPESKSLDDVSV